MQSWARGRCGSHARCARIRFAVADGVDRAAPAARSAADRPRPKRATGLRASARSPISGGAAASRVRHQNTLAFERGTRPRAELRHRVLQRIARAAPDALRPRRSAAAIARAPRAPARPARMRTRAKRGSPFIGIFEPVLVPARRDSSRKPRASKSEQRTDDAQAARIPAAGKARRVRMADKTVEAAAARQPQQKRLRLIFQRVRDIETARCDARRTTRPSADSARRARRLRYRLWVWRPSRRACALSSPLRLRAFERPLARPVAESRASRDRRSARRAAAAKRCAPIGEQKHQRDGIAAAGHRDGARPWRALRQTSRHRGSEIRREVRGRSCQRLQPAGFARGVRPARATVFEAAGIFRRERAKGRAAFLFLVHRDAATGRASACFPARAGWSDIS